MTPQQLNAMKQALEALEGLKSMYGGNGHKLHEINMIHRKHDTAITVLKKVLAEHAMSKVQRLGQEIEQEPVGVVHHKLTSTLGADYEQVAVFVRPIEPGTKLYTTQPQRTEQEPVIDGNTSDGYHTFNELYEFRKAYNIALFNEWAANGKCSVHKSWRHNDGELCFGGGWFIVVAVLPQGQISNHYEAKDWDLFHIQETGKALFEFDGHTGADVIERLKSYTTPAQRTWVELSDEQIEDCYKQGGIGRAIQLFKEKNT